jgi:hypothetical protein
MGFSDFPEVSEAQAQDAFYRQSSASNMVQTKEDEF